MKKLQLISTNPCSQNWDDMQLTKTGKFCDSCAKNVVDLTEKTDQELIEFFKHKKANVCGRLLSTQLHRELISPPQKNNWNWLLPVAFGAAFMSPYQTKAITPTDFQLADHYKPRVFEKRNLVSETLENELIKGKVVDAKTGKALQDVKVKYKNFNNVIAITDSLGNFEFKLTAKLNNEILVFEAVGYELAEKLIANTMQVGLNENKRIIIGGVHFISAHSQPLYIINSGKQSCIADSAQIAKINPEWIEKLEVLKDANATAIYGSRGAHGVIIMEIKKEYKKNIDFSKKK